MGPTEITRRVSASGLIGVCYQQVSAGRHLAGQVVTVRLHPTVLLRQYLPKGTDLSVHSVATWLASPAASTTGTPCMAVYGTSVGTIVRQPRPQATGTSGALLSLNDFGSSVERTAKRHPLWRRTAGRVVVSSGFDAAMAGRYRGGVDSRVAVIDVVDDVRLCRPFDAAWR